MKKTVTAAAVALAAGAALVPGRAAAAGCSQSWGSQAKAVRNATHVTLTAVRAGRHECFDRLVLDTDRNGAAWSVRYVSAVRNQGEGAVIPLKGGAFLEVVQQSQATRRIPMPRATRPSARSGGAAASRATRPWVSASGRVCRSGS